MTFLDSRYLSSEPGVLLMPTNKTHTSWSPDLQDGKAVEKPEAVDSAL